MRWVGGVVACEFFSGPVRAIAVGEGLSLRGLRPSGGSLLGIVSGGGDEGLWRSPANRPASWSDGWHNAKPRRIQHLKALCQCAMRKWHNAPGWLCTFIASEAPIFVQECGNSP